MHPHLEESINSDTQFQGQHEKDKEISDKRYNGSRIPISEVKTVSSKKMSSTSPPNQRDSKEESPMSIVIPIKKSKSNISKSGKY